MDTAHHTRLVLLPGLGADDRLFQPQRAAFPDLIVPPWIAPKKPETLGGYAARLAPTIAPRGPMVLGGVSLGGMVAYAMAPHLQPDAVVLIGSCRSGRAVRPVFRAFKPLLPIAPARLFDVAKMLTPLGVAALEHLSKPQRQLCIAMFKAADSRFMRWAVEAILNWQSDPLEGVSVFQIHGQKDQVIPARRVDPQRLVPGGGHLISLTHAEQVNAFIGEALAGTG